MFFLALLYNLQYPVDDNSCYYHTDESSCLLKTNFLGSSYCQWDSATSSTTPCTYKEPKFTFEVLVLLSWVQLMMMAPIDILIFIAFNYIILAPSVSLVEEQLLSSSSSVSVSSSSSIQRRMSQVASGVRRLSVSIRYHHYPYHHHHHHHHYPYRHHHRHHHHHHHHQES